MEKKIEVEINGKVLRVPEHMIEDMMRFGATITKRTIKNPPKELQNMPAPKRVILPEEKPVVKAEDLVLPGEQMPEPRAIETEKKKTVRRKK